MQAQRRTVYILDVGYVIQGFIGSEKNIWIFHVNFMFSSSWFFLCIQSKKALYVP